MYICITFFLLHVYVVFVGAATADSEGTDFIDPGSDAESM